MVLWSMSKYNSGKRKDAIKEKRNTNDDIQSYSFWKPSALQLTRPVSIRENSMKLDTKVIATYSTD